MTHKTLPSAAAWWIFRKDVRLLWPLAVVFIGLEILLNVLTCLPLPYDANTGSRVEIGLTALAIMLIWALLVTLIVQQDPLPGSNQDWVVRPIRRADLLFGKVLSAIILIHVPIFLTVTTACAITGFSFGQILPAALLDNLYMACVITMPVMAIAAVTRTVLEALLTALGVALGVALAFVLYTFIHRLLFHSLPETGIAVWHEVIWVGGLVSVLLIALTGIATLLISYGWRKVWFAKILFGCGIIVAAAALVLPWRLAYVVQQWLSPAPLARVVSLSFAPDAAPVLKQRNPEWTELMLRYTPKQNLPLIPSEAIEGIILPRAVRIVLPFKVTGVPENTFLHGDRVVLRITGPRGGVHRGSGWNFDLKVPKPGASLLGVAINIPKGLYEKLAHRPVNLRVEFALTLMRPRAFVLGIPSEARLPGLGRCAIRERAGTMGTIADVACMRVGLEPCITAAFDPSSGGGLMGDELLHCPLDYEPALLQRARQPINHFEVKVLPLVFGAAAGRTRFSVSTSHITLSEYLPLAHFMRSVALQDVDLANWRYRPKTPSAATRIPTSAIAFAGYSRAMKHGSLPGRSTPISAARKRLAPEGIPR